MSLYSLYVAAGEAGSFHDSTSQPFTDFLPQIPLYLSYNLTATRTTGTGLATLHVEIQWKNSAGAALTPFTTDTIIDASVDVLQRYTVTPPAGAVSGVAYVKITPAASPMQHHVWIKKLRLGKTALAADVTSENTAVGDANRVRFSQMERGTTGFMVYDTSAGTSAVDQNVNSGKRYVHVGGTFTGANQAGSIGTPGAGTPTDPYIIPLVGGERIFVGASVASGMPSSLCRTALRLYFYNSAGGGLGSVDLFSGLGSDPFWTRRGGFAAVPAGASFGALVYYALNETSGATGPWAIYLAEPMVCSAGSAQTAFPAYSPGPSNLQADAATSVVIDPPADVVIYADNTGVVKTGQLAKDVGLSASIGTSKVTTLGTWTRTATNGITCTIGVNTGIVNITAFTAAEVLIPISFTYNGVTRTVNLHVIRKDDPQTNTSGGTGGGSSTGGTTATSSTLGATNGTSYNSTSVSPVLQAKAGSNAKVDLSANIAFVRTTQTPGTTTVAGKWQWRVVGGTFADVAAETANQYGADTLGGNGDPISQNAGSLLVTTSKTGLTPNTTYEFQFLWRRTSAGIGSSTDVYANYVNETATGS